MTKSSRHSKNTFSPQVQKKINDILLRVVSFKADVDSILSKYKPPPFHKEATQILEYLFLRFHAVVRQLLIRQRNREPFIVRDEYDVQDLLHSLLRIYFEDVRPEEYSESHAGTSPRIDFFLKREQIAIEAKMTSRSHRKRKVREELILDKEYYSKKKGCRLLYCLVYDPEEWISNPRGFEDDLYEKSEKFEVKVFVVPRHSLVSSSLKSETTNLVKVGKPKFEPRLNHIVAWLFYGSAIDYEKGERTPWKNDPRHKLVCNTITKKAYYINSDVWELILENKIRWHSENDQDLEEWCRKMGYELVKRDALDFDLLALE